MSKVSPESYCLARRLLLHEAGARQGQKELADAAQVVCQKLCRRMGQLLGSYEVGLLTQRALAQAMDKFSFLNGVEVGSDGCFRGLGGRVEKQSQEEVMEALVSIIGNFLGLMSIYIGDGMIMHLVETAWPEAFPDNTRSRS